MVPIFFFVQNESHHLFSVTGLIAPQTAHRSKDLTAVKMHIRLVLDGQPLSALDPQIPGEKDTQALFV